MNNKRCFMMGCRTASEEIYPELYRAVEEHIRAYGVTEFLVGNHGAFDRLAARAVNEAKRQFPFVTLTLLLAYYPSVFSAKKDAVPGLFDGSLYPAILETVPKRFAIPRANRYAVTHSKYLIAYEGKSLGNTRQILEYARTVISVVITAL